MWKYLLPLFFVPLFAFAQATPQVTSFTISPPSISNDYSVALTWSIDNGTGYYLYISCPVGVTLSNQDGGASIPCNTNTSPTASISDPIGITVHNVSGGSKVVYVTVYPKDSNGAAYNAGAMSSSFVVSTINQPITNFSLSTSSNTQGNPVTLTWSGIDIPGVNLQLDCVDGVKFSSASVVGYLPCGTVAFPTDLPQSGSVDITPVTGLTTPVTITARLLPAITAGTYDGTHAMVQTFTTSANGPGAGSTPSVTSFTASPSPTLSGTPVTFSWATQGATHANLQFQCSDAYSIETTSGSSTTLLLCGHPAFDPTLPATGTQQVTLRSNSPYTQNVNVTLYPQDSNGIYLGTVAKTISIQLLPQGAAMPSMVNTPFVAPSSPTNTNTPTNVVAHGLFTAPLTRGSRNEQVKTLQAFLATNKTLYPEGLVTGFYGAATEAAVKRFQEKYGVATAGAVGYGNVGPGTRAKLNSLSSL